MKKPQIFGAIFLLVSTLMMAFSECINFICQMRIFWLSNVLVQKDLDKTDFYIFLFCFVQSIYFAVQTILFQAIKQSCPKVAVTFDMWLQRPSIFVLVSNAQSQKFKFYNWRHLSHGLRTPNEGISQRNLKILADVADKICFSRN